jgi:hypothetical protein
MTELITVTFRYSVKDETDDGFCYVQASFNESEVARLKSAISEERKWFGRVNALGLSDYINLHRLDGIIIHDNLHGKPDPFADSFVSIMRNPTGRP